MNPLKRFCYWIIRDILTEMEQRHCVDVTINRAEAYSLGHRLGFDQGQAYGELRGQRMLVSELARYQEERRAETPEVMAEDIERAKKGMVH